MAEWPYHHAIMSAQGDFKQLLDDIEREAQEEGPAAVADLRAMQLRYRMIARLIQRRRELRLTQKQLAARSGIGQAEISKIERGRKSPTLDTYSRLATALDLTSDDLVPSGSSSI
jgi:DNA-binding XRE family transcriptional regulator